MASHRASTGSRQATLKDVALLAGVDPSAVSKVMSGGNISVRPETRQRILDAAAALKYRPNAQARALRNQSSGTFGLLLPDITNPVYAAIVRGAMRRAAELGFSLVLAETAPGDDERSYERLVLEKRIDGLLLANARKSHGAFSRLLHDGVPHVFVNRQANGASPSIIVDDERGAQVAAEALITAGHTQLGVVAGPRDVDTAVRRLAGFSARVSAEGLVSPAVARGDFTPQGGYDAMSKLLARRNRPTAVFASNLSAALGALKAVDDAGLGVPHDISVVSFDDENIAGFTVPALTAVRMPFAEMGSTAVEMLDAAVSGEPVRSVVVRDPAPRLIVRRSLRPA
jgi:DNA-binding LacI/PurR family transcriptional regulator